MTQSRTQKTLKNANVSLIFSILSILIGFFSRKIFIDYLSAEVLGLNTVASNLLGFLNLAELGIGVAISYALYKPLYDNDRQKIIDIITVQGYLYRRIAYLIFGASGVLMCFFPWIFDQTELPLWYAYATFSILLCSALFGYVWNYKQILLSADQKFYKLTINQQTLFFLKVFLQLGLIALFPSIGYHCWLVIELLFAIIRTLELNRVVNKEYPWLKIDLSRGKSLLKSHSEIITKTKQLFAHKVATVALNQASPMVMYAYTSLAVVAYYGNYMTLVLGVSRLFNSLFSSTWAAVGNLVAQGDKKHIDNLFWELFTSRFWITLCISIPLYHLSSPFITLWLGEQYLLANETLLMMVAIFFIGITRGIVDSFISGYGLYHDIWAAFTESAINIVASIVLGYFFGITGVLSGIALSLLAIVLIWKPYFLYTEGFKRPIGEYIKGYAIHFAILVATAIASQYLLKYLPYNPAASVSHFIWVGIILTLSTSLLSGILYYLFTPGHKRFLSRVHDIIKKKYS